jgi:hypothetical protein
VGKCPDCGIEMKPLAYSEYCPNDCDRKVQEEVDPEKTPKIVCELDDLDVGPPDPNDVCKGVAFDITDEELDQLFKDIMIDGTD